MGRLEERFVANAKFPTVADAARLLELERWSALFDNDREAMYSWVHTWRVAARASNEEGSSLAPLREFISYPAPRLAARTLASFLFGEDAKITSDNAEDELAMLIEENHLHALNQESAITAAAEGEIYYKLDWDEDVSERAIISSVPPARVFPLFRFRRLAEVAFVRELEHDRGDRRKVMRHVEIREPGRIVNRLFFGSAKALGVELELEEHPDTAGLEAEEETDIDDVLVRHVPFFRTARSPHGISIYDGNEGLIEGIHALYTQDQHDAEMTKRRVAIPSQYLKRTSSGRPTFDRQLDLFELSDDAMGPVGGGQSPVQTIEFTDSTVMGQRIAQRLDEFLLACGIAPQSAGRDVTGSGESGTARKLAQTLTLQTVATAARYFSPSVRDVCALAIEIGAKHLGRAAPTGGDETTPARANVKLEMGDGVPEDPKELAEILAALAGAQAISTEEKVRRQHPSWTDAMVTEEVDRIREDEGLALPAPMPIGGPNDDEGGTG